MSGDMSGTINDAINPGLADIGISHGTESESHSGVTSYIIGFVLSVILTAAPFWAVMTGAMPRGTTMLVVVATALMQIVVHLKYFLHLDFSSEGKASSFAFLFTALIIVMVVGLSIWIIYSANALMM